MRNILLLALLPLSDALAAPVLRAVSSVTSPLAPIFDKLARASAGNYDVPAVRAAIHRERQSAPVVIFGYELSPFCGRARQMLEDEGVHESQIKRVGMCNKTIMYHRPPHQAAPPAGPPPRRPQH